MSRIFETQYPGRAIKSVAKEADLIDLIANQFIEEEYLDMKCRMVVILAEKHLTKLRGRKEAAREKKSFRIEPDGETTKTEKKQRVDEQGAPMGVGKQLVLPVRGEKVTGQGSFEEEDEETQGDEDQSVQEDKVECAWKDVVSEEKSDVESEGELEKQGRPTFDQRVYKDLNSRKLLTIREAPDH